MPRSKTIGARAFRIYASVVFDITVSKGLTVDDVQGMGLVDCWVDLARLPKGWVVSSEVDLEEMDVIEISD